MSLLPKSRGVLAFILLVLLTSPTWAEYCKSQGSPALPKSQAPIFDAQALLSAPEMQDAEQRHLPWGRPDCPRILFQREYVLCYDQQRRVAMWTSYRMEAADVVEVGRLNASRSDPRLPESQNPACDDYFKSGFDRGHLVPRSDMNRTKVAMVNTFFLTNMSPQMPNVNQGTWERLERLGRLWAVRFGAVHIVSGTIFDDDDDRSRRRRGYGTRQGGQRGGGPVALLQDFHSAVRRPDREHQLHHPQLGSRARCRNSSDATRDKFLRRSIRRVSQILDRSGVDLFPEMPAAQKDSLKTFRAADLWPTN